MRVAAMRFRADSNDGRSYKELPPSLQRGNAMKTRLEIVLILMKFINAGNCDSATEAGANNFTPRLWD